ncbi:MAG: oligopeptide/dipeptide ABC transporter ATP-binding protein, partial [Pseudomonadota bacterium]
MTDFKNRKGARLSSGLGKSPCSFTRSRLRSIFELAGREEIYEDARHPYTKALISAVPNPDPKMERSRERVKLQGDLPSPLDSRAPVRFL